MRESRRPAAPHITLRPSLWRDSGNSSAVFLYARKAAASAVPPFFYAARLGADSVKTRGAGKAQCAVWAVLQAAAAAYL